MTHQFLIFVASATLVLVGLNVVQQKLTPTDSGIYGTATIGPACPVQRAGDNACADRPFQASLSVYTYDPRQPVIMIYPPVYATGHKVTTFTTGPDGRFRLALAPGDYVIRKEGSATPPSLYNQKVTVKAHEFIQVNLTFDSGIR